jgi:hypothetical protein
VIGKTLAGAAPGMFRIEAGGPAALRTTGHLATPQVLAVTGLAAAPGGAGGP